MTEDSIIDHSAYLDGFLMDCSDFMSQVVVILNLLLLLQQRLTIKLLMRVCPCRLGEGTFLQFIN